MTLKTLAAAATLAVFATTGVNAATFDFTFDASGADSGDTSLTAVGTLDINVAPGESFSNSDISDVMIVVDSELFAATNLTDSIFTVGQLSADGSNAVFSDLLLRDNFNMFVFGCQTPDCTSALIGAGSSLGVDASMSAGFGAPATALSEFQATAQVSAVPLPAGGLLLLSGLGGIAAFKRRKKRAA